MTTEQLKDFIAELANNLADAQSVEMDDMGGAKIFLKSGGYLWLRSAGYRDNRLEVHGNFHLDTVQKDGTTRSEYYGSSWISGQARIVSPSIIFNADKGAAKCAADIRRRFLPRYVSNYALAVGLCNAANNQKASGAANLLKLATVIPELAGHTKLEACCYVNDFRLELNLTYAPQVNVKLDKALPVDKAIALIEFLKTL